MHIDGRETACLWPTWRHGWCINEPEAQTTIRPSNIKRPAMSNALPSWTHVLRSRFHFKCKATTYCLCGSRLRTKHLASLEEFGKGTCAVWSRKTAFLLQRSIISSAQLKDCEQVQTLETATLCTEASKRTAYLLEILLLEELDRNIWETLHDHHLNKLTKSACRRKECKSDFQVTGTL